jgi:hypothetical protein
LQKFYIIYKTYTAQPLRNLPQIKTLFIWSKAVPEYGFRLIFRELRGIFIHLTGQIVLYAGMQPKAMSADSE